MKEQILKGLVELSSQREYPRLLEFIEEQRVGAQRTCIYETDERLLAQAQGEAKVLEYLYGVLSDPRRCLEAIAQRQASQQQAKAANS